MNKTELRKQLKGVRRTLSDDFIHSASTEITNKIIGSNAVLNAKTVMVYLSAFNEPNTFDLISRLLSSGTNICVPVTDINTHTITPCYLKSLDTLKRGAYGIYEPCDIISVPTDDIDTVLVPGIGFDKQGNRLGFGKGYYDRFLKSFCGTKIGVCYDFQITNLLPVSAHDIKMDFIITEKRIYNDF